MSVSDEEVRKAADSLLISDPDGNVNLYDDIDTVCTQALAELARRDREAAEASARSKPIDDNLMKSLGFHEDEDGVYLEHQLLRGQFSFDLKGELTWEHRDDVLMIFKAAGKLIDFIDMVRGGGA